jgi:hypothetical protein
MKSFLYVECGPLKISIGNCDKEEFQDFFFRHPSEVKKTILLICYKYNQGHHCSQGDHHCSQGDHHYNQGEIAQFVYSFKVDDFIFEMRDQSTGIRSQGMKFNLKQDRNLIQAVQKLEIAQYPSEKLVQFLTDPSLSSSTSSSSSFFSMPSFFSTFFDVGKNDIAERQPLLKRN